ncbi:peptidylprolyl isomerase [Nitrosococcus wardiae]|uniref:peptidylprolyl isomerase n=1 Tax=Nitrosococcus wardiae TaxID=1814290 RepID=A0A4V1AVL5_9GAMM|nr:peptidylprolyl isomerase [Nitrosococcus wardiae]QBQ53555.1 hypothetical protein E3U44_02815 [Nitrosococcus wardiae]
MKANQPNINLRAALGRFAFLGILVSTAVSATEGEVISRSSQGQLTAEDYRAYARLFDPAARERLAAQKDRMLDFALDFHSNQVLAQQAEAQGLAEDPIVQARLEKARREVLVGALMDQVVKNIDYPDFETLSRQRYAAEKAHYRLPEKRKVAHILIRPKNPECACDQREPAKIAATIMEELESGTDFAELARRYSEDRATAKQGGLLDQWLEKDSGKVVPAFEQAAFALSQPGDFSQPFETRFGRHVVQLIELEPARQLSYEEVKERLINKLRAEYRDSALLQLRGKTYPDPDKINYPTLKEVLSQ